MSIGWCHVWDPNDKVVQAFYSLEVLDAALPYYPEMLNFDLDENKSAEYVEIVGYVDHFAKGTPDANAA